MNNMSNFHEYAQADSKEEAEELRLEGWTFVETKLVEGEPRWVMGRNPPPHPIHQLATHPLHKGHSIIGLLLMGGGGVMLLFFGGANVFNEIIIGVGLVLLLFGLFEFRGEK